jgi:hypothetical protein|tara:strand:+ start:4005 stop:4517 length:513 start_codon:yes stop_codon:yes gene_type:complete
MAEYINNKEFYQLLIEYKESSEKAKIEEKDPPRIPNKIGEAFILIATRLSNKGNFVGYTYKDEMVSDAIENCVNAVHSFNPEKSKNPFAYFTQIIWYAFLRRIEKEKKQTYIKYKSLEAFMLECDMSEEEGNPFANFDIDNEKMKPIIEKYEKKKPKDIKPKGIEKFIGE